MSLVMGYLYPVADVASDPLGARMAASPEGGDLAAEHNPLLGPSPKEVPLPNAPLVTVIAQVRFSPILSVQDAQFVAPFQEAVRATYPVLSQEQAQSLVVGPQGVAAGQKQVAWRFTNVDGAWRLSLAPEFVALETTAYTSRSNFMERMQAVLRAVGKHLDPAVVQRVGLRYIDRVTGDALGDITELIRSEMLGIVTTPLSQYAQHAISEAVLDVPDNTGQLHARWGRLPADSTVDPNAIEPINEPSWILDIDMFSNHHRPFAAAQLIEDLGRFAEHIYTMFRWSVTDQFLRRYGGKP